ncbi:pentatricopeptide repeat-containing protein At1g11900-like [Ananas comosus]|uniref:Pentatricopeptide repeat-containing protein At1g11900-like n=1 Tax=Ananas comosus TaxID=4615 RepID=A0A6P5GYT4_ANACO|nr:pentatricopeptide repeat-containing protein At1g11900-like [Ananas comosus]
MRFSSQIPLFRSISRISIAGIGSFARFRSQNRFFIGCFRERSSLGSQNRNGSRTCSLSRRSIMCADLVDNGLLPFAAAAHDIFNMRTNRRSMVTWDSDDDGEITNNFDLFYSTSKGKNISDKDICSAYIEMLCSSGNLAEAVSLLRHLQNRQTHVSLNVYNILLSLAAEANNFSLFSKIFKYLLTSKVPPDFTSYCNVAKAFQKVDDSELLLKFIRDVSEITCDREPTVVNRIVFAVGDSGQIDKSLMIFEELKKIQFDVNVVTFNTVLGILGRSGQVDRMLSEFTQMKDLGYSPDLVTYNTVINCLRRMGKFGLCKDFAREMFEKGINMDLRTYTAVIDGLGRAGHVEEALNMFSEMKKSQQPSIYIYRALISDLKRAGKFELALNLSEEMNSTSSKLIGPKDFKPKQKVKMS